jgi:hypothetical protein
LPPGRPAPAPAEIGEGGHRVLEEHHPEAGEQQVEAAGRERMAAGIGQDSLGLRQPRRGDAGTRHGDRGLRDIGTQCPPAGPDGACQRQQGGTGGAANIEHPLAGPRCREIQQGLAERGEAGVDALVLMGPGLGVGAVPVGALAAF